MSIHCVSDVIVVAPPGRSEVAAEPDNPCGSSLPRRRQLQSRQLQGAAPIPMASRFHTFARPRYTAAAWALAGACRILAPSHHPSDKSSLRSGSRAAARDQGAAAIPAAMERRLRRVEFFQGAM